MALLHTCATQEIATVIEYNVEKKQTKNKQKTIKQTKNYAENC